VYDIFGKTRLPKVKKVVYSYALGGQKSALEAPLNKELMKSLINEISNYLEDIDKVNIIKIVDSPILLGRASNTSYENNSVLIL